MTIAVFTANLTSQYAAELANVIYDATTGSSWFRSNAADKYLTFVFPMTIPSGATVNSAIGNFYTPIASANEPDHKIDAEDVPNATEPAAGDANNSISSRTGTTAYVTWYSADLGGVGYYDTPDLSAVIQELVDSYDFSSGANVLIRLTRTGATGDIGIANPNYSGAPVATLTVDYTESGGASHALTIAEIVTGTPAIGVTNATRNVVSHALTIAGIETGSPVIGTINATRNTASHVLTIAGIETDAPAIGVINATRNTANHTLAIAGIETGSPVIEAINASRNAVSHALTIAAIMTGTPEIGGLNLRKYTVTALGETVIVSNINRTVISATIDETTIAATIGKTIIARS